MKILSDRSIAIIGFGEVPNVKSSMANALDLAAYAAREALASCGLDLADIDGVSGEVILV